MLSLGTKIWKARGGTGSCKIKKVSYRDPWHSGKTPHRVDGTCKLICGIRKEGRTYRDGKDGAKDSIN